MQLVRKYLYISMCLLTRTVYLCISFTIRNWIKIGKKISLFWQYDFSETIKSMKNIYNFEYVRASFFVFRRKSDCNSTAKAK